jgi:hypothetical protein
MIKILFSYRKGLFVYTPVAFISLGGLYYIYKKSKLSFFSFLLFFLAITYVFSCWWAWWYGGSFSSRPYVEFLGVFGILLAFLLNEIHPKKWKAYIITLLGFFIVLCQVQTYQFRYYIIHWSLMDKEHYWRVFMRVDQIIKKENANKDLLELPEEE